MFKKSKPIEQTQDEATYYLDAEEHRIDTQIAQGVTFKGNLNLPESGLHLQGEIIGNVEFATAMMIVEGAIVQGNVIGRLIHLRGSILGDIDCDEIIIYPGATVEGQLKYRLIDIRPGASVKGAMQPMQATMAKVQDLPVHSDLRMSR